MNDHRKSRGGGVDISHNVVFRSSVIESGKKVWFGDEYLPHPGDVYVFEDIHSDCWSIQNL